MRHRDIMTFVFLLTGITLGCGDSIPPGNTVPEKTGPVSVQTMNVSPAIYPILYDAVGSVKAQASATLSSKLMGTITEVKVKEGDTVKRGDILVRIDARQVTSQLMQAQAALDEAKKAEAAAISSLNAAEAGAEQARLAYNRGQKMLEGEAITKQDFENIEAQFKQAQASLAQARSMVEASGFRVKQARAGVDASMVSEKDTRITAPYDGKITAKMVNAGNLAAPGTPLVTIEGEGAYRVDLVVPENYIQAIRPDQAVNVRIPTLGDTPIQGSVFVIVPAADQISRTFIVQVIIPRDERIYSGMFARVALPVGEKEMIRIPQSSLVHQGQLTGVFMVDTDNVARFRLIRTGSTFDDQVEVISGIPDQTRIVASPTSQLKNGSHVEWSK